MCSYDVAGRVENTLYIELGDKEVDEESNAAATPSSFLFIYRFNKAPPEAISQTSLYFSVCLTFYPFPYPGTGVFRVMNKFAIKSTRSFWLSSVRLKEILYNSLFAFGDQKLDWRRICLLKLLLLFLGYLVQQRRIVFSDIRFDLDCLWNCSTRLFIIFILHLRINCQMKWEFVISKITVFSTTQEDPLESSLWSWWWGATQVRSGLSLELLDQIINNFHFAFENKLSDEMGICHK